MIDRRAPGVRVAVLSEDGRRSPLSKDLVDRLMSFTFQESDNKADAATFEFRNTDLALFDNEEVVSGKTLEVSWGHPGQMSTPRRVVVKKRRGFERLRVEGRAESVQLDRVKKTRAFKDKSRTDVARSIATEQGYARTAQTIDGGGETQDVINQAGETDARFLTRLASEEGYQFFVDDTGFHFHEARQDDTPAMLLRWRGGDTGEVLSVGEVDIDVAQRVGKVVVKGRDPIEKKTVNESADNKSEKRSALAGFIEVVDPDSGATTLQEKNATKSESASAAKNASAAKAEASRRFKAAERNSVRLPLTVRGDARLRAKSIVRIEGISKALSGNYRVTDATTKIVSGGYTVELKTVRDGLSGAERNHLGDKNDKKAKDKNKLEAFEGVDPDTGDTTFEYRRPS